MQASNRAALSEAYQAGSTALRTTATVIIVHQELSANAVGDIPGARPGDMCLLPWAPSADNPSARRPLQINTMLGNMPPHRNVWQDGRQVVQKGKAQPSGPRHLAGPSILLYRLGSSSSLRFIIQQIVCAQTSIWQGYPSSKVIRANRIAAIQLAVLRSKVRRLGFVFFLYPLFRNPRVFND